MSSQYIYLLQEREFIKTKENVYKVGRTEKENHKRFEQYPKGSVLLFQIMCDNCRTAERNILLLFKSKFVQRKDIGNEYFEGDYKAMMDLIYLTVKNDISSHEINKSDDTDEDENNNTDEENKFEKLYKNMCVAICEIFPDYRNDVSFGGTKKYIKIVPDYEGRYRIRYISEDLNENLLDGKVPCMGSEFDEYVMNSNVCDKLLYFEQLIKKKIIIVDNVYDINSIDFADKINNTKHNIHIEHFDAIKLHALNNNGMFTRERIRQMFNCNVLMDGMYATLVMDDYKTYKCIDKLKNFTTLQIDIGDEDNYNIIKLVYINSKFYEMNIFLRKYTPYALDWDNVGNYWLVNRDYELIGSYRKDRRGKYHEYLFNDTTVPWVNEINMTSMQDKLRKLIFVNDLVKCMNYSEFTEEILNL